MKRRLVAAFLLVLCLPLLTIPLCNDQVVDHYIDKIWLHRTNTIEKLHEFEDEYKNFECDVLFVPELNDFRIGHDSPSSESLGLYLDYLGRNPERELWIDLKNLTEANCRRAESLLTAMLARTGADKEQLIVESRNWKALRLFTEQGYYTSCYLDIPRLDEMSDDERTRRLDSVQLVARSGAVSAVSFPASYYVFLRDLDFPIDMLTWEHRRWAWQLPFFSRSRAILKDNRVKVVLVKEKGHYHQ